MPRSPPAVAVAGIPCVRYVSSRK